MRQPPRPRTLLAALAGLSLVLPAAACGNQSASGADSGKQQAGSASPSGDGTSARLGDGEWLIAVNAAGGEDAETLQTSYIHYRPASGAATKRVLPPVKAGTSDDRTAALLVSADRKWALPDTSIPGKQGRSGKLTVYSLDSDATRVLDLPRLADRRTRPVAWAFDPKTPDTLRIVDTRNRVWSVSVSAADSGGKARQQGSLPDGSWIFTNGFNPNTGAPWVESIESNQTRPRGNGVADRAPVQRAGGVVLAAESASLDKLPQRPCDMAAGFRTEQDATWLFCADSASLKTYVLEPGSDQWRQYGKPSPALAPEAATMPLVLPPVPQS